MSKTCRVRLVYIYIQKGPSYREQNYINWKINERICRNAIAEYKHKWSSKQGVDIRVFNEWESIVNKCIERIRYLREKHVNRRKEHVLKSRKHLNYLRELHSKYVLVPADKAANNVIVVCKKYYLDVVLKEVNTTNTYEHVDKECTDVIAEHLKFMARGKIEVEPILQYLPSFYWLPKLHKQPYGARFIAASSKCTTKPLSKLLTRCLNLIACHFEQYCGGIYSRTGVNCYWIISNSQQVLSTLSKINYFSVAKHFDTYDFSTLYTAIPHASLKHALAALIKEAYDVRDSTFIIVDGRGKAYWSDVPSRASSKYCITEETLIAYVDYLVDNIYVNIKYVGSVWAYQWCSFTR